jgi:tetratricopeptide (TPR) repeat protein
LLYGKGLHLNQEEGLPTEGLAHVRQLAFVSMFFVVLVVGKGCTRHEQVQEAAAASEGLLRIPDVAVNLGNLHLAQQEYVAAIQMYQSTLRRFYGGQDASVMLYLARAFYDSDRLPEARQTLIKAVHLQPTNHQLRFNIALTMQARPHTLLFSSGVARCLSFNYVIRFTPLCIRSFSMTRHAVLRFVAQT